MSGWMDNAKNLLKWLETNVSQFVPMDLRDILILCVVAILFYCWYYIFYTYSRKTQSYEEVMAAQRLNGDSLLGPKKSKEKKSKKSSKKNKEKPTGAKNESNGSTEPSTSKQTEIINPKQTVHVEFKEEPEQLLAQENKKPTKKEKIRPILINKEVNDKVKVTVNNAPIINHFEEIHPKDDFELLRANSKEDLSKADQKDKRQLEAESVKSKKSKSSAAVEDSPPPENGKEKKNESPLQSSPSGTSNLVVNGPKEKKKKKGESNNLQLSSGAESVINVVRNAVYHVDEIPIFIDILLDKQRALSIIGEWSEGKFDPVQKLKKQLAEKEKQLIDEQEALAGVQAKLREIRSEQQAEKSQLLQKIRRLEELEQSKNLEIQANNNRYQSSQQKIQQLQDQLNNDILKIQHLSEENRAFILHKQQIEMSLSHNQENEAQLRAAEQEYKNQIQQMQIELTRVTEERQNVICAQIAALQKDLEISAAANRDLQERLYSNENGVRNEISHYKTLIQQQAENIRNKEYQLEQALGEIRQISEDNVETKKINAQLKDELERFLEEKNLWENERAHKLDLVNLNNELIRNEQQAKIVAVENDNKFIALQKELEEQRAKNNDLRQKNWKVMEALKAAESRTASNTQKIDVSKLSNEIILKEQESQKQFIQRLFPEINELKTIDLTEDWQIKIGKIISNYVDNLKRSQESMQERISNLVTNVEHYKRVIEDTDIHLIQCENDVKVAEIKWRQKLFAKDAEIQVLKEQISSKNTVIASQGKIDTSGVQFAYQCIEKSLPTIISELELQVETLKKELLLVQKENQVLVSENEQLKGKPVTADAAQIEKLFEENNNLKEIIRTEQLTKVPKEQNFRETNGLNLVEHSLSSSSTSLASFEVITTKKSKNKKKKKKGNGN